MHAPPCAHACTRMRIFRNSGLVACNVPAEVRDSLKAAGEEVPADLQNWAGIVQEPNRYQFLVRMFEDPDAAAEYIATKCTQEILQDTEALLLAFFLESDDYDRLDGDLRMVQCVDNFGALSEATRYCIDIPQAAIVHV